MKEYTATRLNKSAQEVFAAAKEDGAVEIKHNRYAKPFTLLSDTDGLKEYLLSHECDITWGINDFDSLSGIFTAIIGRKPEIR